MSQRQHFLVSIVATAMVTAAAGLTARQPQGQSRLDIAMNDLAEQYVHLVLSMGEHDPDYVDAYYGPGTWREQAIRDALTLPQIDAAAEMLLTALERTAPQQDPGDANGSDSLPRLRRQYLQRQLQALRTRVRMLGGQALTFDDESDALYDAVAPRHAEAYFSETLAALDARLAGAGPLIDRYGTFRSAFVIPPDRLDQVFGAAIAECRRRTLEHIDLPEDERFTVEYVTDKSWSGYNWYQGDFRSLIQVNTDLPIYIDRAIDLACHEGYPGHHVYNVLLEQHLVRARGWSEFSVYALFSPQSLIAEGTANYGIDVAFSRDERLRFEREVLFPAAGLDPSRAEEYYDVHALLDQLDYAGNEAARRYLNGEIDRTAATEWMTRYAMMAPERAAQRTRFFDQYRSYVINYNLGKDLVAEYVGARSNGDATTRWDIFAALLASPRLPSGLRD